MAYFSGISAFLDYKYWLNLRPVPLPSGAVSAMLSFFAWFVIAAVILYVVARLNRKKRPRYAELAKRFASPLLTTGILGLLFLFFTYELIPLLSMRLWFLLLTAYFLVLVGKLAHYVVVDFPKLRHDDLERERIQKYLPKKK